MSPRQHFQGFDLRALFGASSLKRRKRRAPTCAHEGRVLFYGVLDAPAKSVLLALVAGLWSGAITMRAAESPTNPPPSCVQLAIEFRQGTLMVPTRVNGSQPLVFKLDSGFGINTVHPDLVETLKLRPAGTMTILGIAGQEKANTYTGADFDFNGAKYAPRRVAVIPSDAQRRRRGRDGILGAGFFRRFVVEIDPTKNTMTLHEPAAFEYKRKGEIIPLEFLKDTPIIEALINLPKREPIRAKYEIDSGCDGELCLGHDFVTSHRLDNNVGAGRTGSRSGVGGSVDTRHDVLPQFQIGSQKLDNLPVNFFLVGSPVDEGLAGHIGMGTLRQFKVIFDYSRKRMILEPLK